MKKAKGLFTQKQGQLGVNVVERVVLQTWSSRWQAIDCHNDDGIDGLIFIERGGAPTGQIVFAQVKCQKARENKQDELCLAISKSKLERNLTRWRHVVGAAILIHVDPVDLTARWVNVRQPGALGDTQIFVPKSNAFDKRAKTQISGLCGNIHRDLLLREAHCSNSDFAFLLGGDHIQSEARRIYRSLEANPVHLGGTGPRVRFTRDGWRHITRPGRNRLVRYQSFALLGAARAILEATPASELRRDKNSDREVFTTKAAVRFPFRQTAVVKIALRSNVAPSGELEYSFLTIYEPRRRRSVLGARAALPANQEGSAP